MTPKQPERTDKMRRFTGILVALGITTFFVLAGAIDAHAATECLTFDLAYEVRPGPAQALIGVTVDIDSWDLPDHWAGLPGTLRVETANGPSVHWNNYATLSTNGFATNVTGTEDTANGVRIGDSTITAIGATLDAAYTIGARDSRDVPGVEGASLEGSVTICATVPDVTTTTTSVTTTTTASTTTTSSTTSTTEATSTTSTTPSTSSTVPASSTTSSSSTSVPGSTTTTGPTPPSTGNPPSTSTTFPETSEPTLPLTGPAGVAGLGMAGVALLTLGGAVLAGRES